MARPTIMTKDVIDKLEYAFSLGCSDNEACLHADIAIQTLYKYQERTPQFLERKHKLKDSPIFIARQSVIKGMKNDPDLALKFLERRKKNEFSTKTESDVNVHLPQPILGGKSQIDTKHDVKRLVVDIPSAENHGDI